MKTTPNKIIYNKNHKSINFKGNPVSCLFYTAAIKLLQSGFVKPRQLEAFRVTLKRRLRKRKKKKYNKKNLQLIRSRMKKFRRRRRRKKIKVKTILKLGFHQPLTAKPLQVRMGKGKGNPYIWVKPTRANDVICEISRRRLGLRKIYKSSSWKGFGKNIRFSFSRHFLRKQHNYRIFSKHFLK